MELITFLAGYIAGLATLILLWIAGFVLGPWARAFTGGARVPLMSIVGMRLRRTPPHFLIDAYIRLVKKDMKPKMDDIELLYIAHRENIHTAADLVDLVRYGEK